MHALRNRTKGLSLHTKFIVLLTGVSLVPLLVVGTVMLVRFQQTLETDASKLGQQLAATASAEIKSFMVSQLRVLDNVSALYQPEFPIEPEIAEGILENIMFQSENFSDISVAGKDGREIVRKNRLLVIDAGDLRDQSQSLAFKAVREGGIYVGPVVVQNGRPFFNLSIQVRNARGEFIGAVFAEVDASIMPLVVSEISEIVGRPGRVYIVNDKGVVIAHPDLSYVLGERDLSGLPAVKNVVEASGATGVSKRYINEEGLDVLGSAHPMSIELFNTVSQESPHISWFVIAEQPADVVYRDARQAAIFSMLISLITVILAAYAAFFFAGRISRPIESLHEAAQEFGKGNLEHRANVETGDEIGELAQSFNTMAETIGQAMRSLKRDEEIVSAERNKLSLILSGITNAVVAVDLEGKIILFNRAAEALTGKSASSVIGSRIQDIVLIYNGEREVPPTEYCPQKEAVAEGPVYSKNDLRMKDEDGKEHIVNLVSGRIREGASIRLGCILTFQDITREYAMERTKREFVSIAAHQLRTPLTSMKWAVDYLIEGAKGELAASQKVFAMQALQATNRMIHLVDDLLDVSRVEEGRFGINPSLGSFYPVLDRVLEALQKKGAEKKIAVFTDIEKGMPDFRFDEDKVEIALDNILDNAIKYTPLKGTIHVSLKREGVNVVLAVRDSGIGIPRAEFDRIFTKFFRSSQAFAHHTDGSGLGLYVAKNVVDQHGGRIWFESEENVGTTFFISLPLISS